MRRALAIDGDAEPGALNELTRAFSSNGSLAHLPGTYNFLLCLTWRRHLPYSQYCDIVMPLCDNKSGLANCVQFAYSTYFSGCQLLPPA